jgi:hypothetical protein
MTFRYKITRLFWENHPGRSLFHRELDHFLREEHDCWESLLARKLTTLPPENHHLFPGEGIKEEALFPGSHP